MAKKKDSAALNLAGPVPSARVTISADVPISQLHAGISRMLTLADSAALTIRGDAKRIASAVLSLGARVDIRSARLTIGGKVGKSAVASMRGDTEPK
jgi:hypothetical protein